MNRVKAEWLTIGTGDIIPPTRKRGEEVDRDALTGEDGGMPDDSTSPTAVAITSFAYGRGIPEDAEVVFDMRFLTDPARRMKDMTATGKDDVVRDIIEAQADFQPFFDHVTGLISIMLPRYGAQEKERMHIAVGCIGGHHRSVYLAEKLAAWLDGQGVTVAVTHRELD